MASTVLSASTLSLFLECPRCFYLHAVRGVKRPSGPFPSLPSGMDALIKEHFDRYRAAGALPPEVVGLVDGALFPDQRTLDAWRSSRRGLRTNLAVPGVTLTGALDECLVSDGRYVPVDFKTRGYERKGDTDRLYQHQLDIYALLLDANGYPAADHAYLLYYIPNEVADGGVVRFTVDVVRLSTDPDRARDLVARAARVIEGEVPPASPSCSFCAWARRAAEA